jgi:hypothetical protein
VLCYCPRTKRSCSLLSRPSRNGDRIYWGNPSPSKLISSHSSTFWNKRLRPFPSKGGFRSSLAMISLLNIRRVRKTGWHMSFHGSMRIVLPLPTSPFLLFLFPPRIGWPISRLLMVRTRRHSLFYSIFSKIQLILKTSPYNRVSTEKGSFMGGSALTISASVIKISSF